MAKSRSINSAIRMSQSFAKLTHRQRDLWHGIIVVADDQGRLPGLAAAIRSMVWPLDNISIEEVESDILAVEDVGMIFRYEIDTKSYMQIVNWWKYQKMQWAGESSYPPVDGWLDRCRYHGPGRKIYLGNWDTPGGFFIPASKEVNDNDNDNVNDDVKPLTQSTTTKVCDKGSQNLYSSLLTTFINISKLPLLGNLTKRDNESLLRMVEAECTPEDIEAAVKYNQENDLRIVGVASIERGAMIERSKRHTSPKPRATAERDPLMEAIERARGVS